MITFDAFLVFLGAASLPVIYLFILSRWLERESRQTDPNAPVRESRPVMKHELTRQSALLLTAHHSPKGKLWLDTSH